MKQIIELFLIFAKMGAVNFGGGYALLPILEKEIVAKRGWAESEELADYYAIGQCTPGVISVNVSTFIGYKLKGIPGGIAATVGFITPSVFIILFISSILSTFSENVYVQQAFSGIRVCVVVLILSAVIKLFKKAVIDKPTLILFILVASLTIVFNVSPIICIVICGILGIVINNIMLKRGNEE